MLDQVALVRTRWICCHGSPPPICRQGRRARARARWRGSEVLDEFVAEQRDSNAWLLHGFVEALPAAAHVVVCEFARIVEQEMLCLAAASLELTLYVLVVLYVLDEFDAEQRDSSSRLLHGFVEALPAAAHVFVWEFARFVEQEMMCCSCVSARGWTLARVQLVGRVRFCVFCGRKG